MARSQGKGRRIAAVDAPECAAPSDRVVFFALVLLAWAHRLLFLWSNRDREWPLSIFYEGDGETFFRHARAMLEGRVYDGGIPFHPPGFPAFLALLHSLLGAGPGAEVMPHLAVKVSLALVSSVGVGVLYLLVRPYLGRPAALLAALLCVYQFGLYVLAVATVAEGLYLTLLLLALLIWSRWMEHPLRAPTRSPSGAVTGVAAPVLLGLVLGVMALTRAEGQLWFALLVGVGMAAALATTRRGWSSLAPWFLVIAACSAVVLPWTVRNRTALSQFNARFSSTLVEPLPTFVPITIYGPLNFALANHGASDGSFSADLLMSGKASARLDFREAAVQRLVVHGYRIGWAWIAEHPADFVRLAVRRWRLSAEVFRLGWSQWNWPGGLTGERRPVDMFVPRRAAFVGYLVPLAVVAGFLVCWHKRGAPRRWALVVAMASSVWLLTTGLFFGYVRLALLCVPLWYSLASAAVVFGGAGLWRHPALRRLTSRRFGMLPWLALLVVAGLVLEGWGATTNRNYRASAASTVDGHHLNRDDTIHLEPLP